ncbi:MAG: phosphoribosylanthranilate isomerase, partial [Lachnospiraceae bacterium]|nr:phosphoribosylanthranilate isomerase [Lachnospiraceae bacterium]
MSAQVKICGLTRPEDVETVNAAGPEFAGFVFYEKSKRNVSFDTAGDLLARLDRRICPVAVCVSPDRSFLEKIAPLRFGRIQIHGDIDPVLLDSVDIPVWQAVNISDSESLKVILHHPGICGYVIDAAEFGSGKTFGWEQAQPAGSKAGKTDSDAAEGPKSKEIREAVGEKQFILAGG